MKYHEIKKTLDEVEIVDVSRQNLDWSSFPTHPNEEEDYRNTQMDLFPDIPTLMPKLPKSMKKIGNIGEMTVVLHKDARTHEIILFDKNKGVAKIELEDVSDGRTVHYWKASGYRVDSIFVAEGYTGKDLALKLYRWILLNYANYLMAGESQTKGGVKIWKKLVASDEFTTYIIGYDENYEDDVKLVDNWEDFKKVYDNDDFIPLVTIRDEMPD